MPRYDGTGPRGAGPMTGRGEGYCAMELSEADRPARGFAGLEARPVELEESAAAPARWSARAARRWSLFGRGLARAARRGRGRRLSGW